MKHFILILFLFVAAGNSIHAQDSPVLSVSGSEAVIASDLGEIRIDTIHLSIPAEKFYESVFSRSSQTPIPVADVVKVKSLGDNLLIIFGFLVIIVSSVIAIGFLLCLLLDLIKRNYDNGDRHFRGFMISILVASIATVILALLYGKYSTEIAIGIVSSVVGAFIYGFIRRLFSSV